MDSSISKACQELCRQAAVEHDPARLLTLFLQIDRLVDQGSPKCTRGGNNLPNDLAVSQVVCPHCWAIIEFTGTNAAGELLQCPWCSGPFNVRKVISDAEYGHERPDWPRLQYVTGTSNE